MAAINEVMAATSIQPTVAARQARFEDFYVRHSAAVRRYVLRRARPDEVDDIVSETFVVAWRRFDGIPPEHALLWLLGVARRVLSTQRRGAGRREQLVERIALEPVPAVDPADEPPDRVHAALARLSDSDRELLMLVYWDDLPPATVARLLGTSPVAVRVRLHRARTRMKRLLAAEPTLTEEKPC